MSDTEVSEAGNAKQYLAHLRRQQQPHHNNDAENEPLSNFSPRTKSTAQQLAHTTAFDDDNTDPESAREALSKLPSSVIEMRCMELLKKNRDLNVRIESEKARNIKLQNRIIAFEKEKMEAEQKREVLLPSERRAQQLLSNGQKNNANVRRNKDGQIEFEGAEAMLADAENQIRQLQAQVTSGNKALALFRKQVDESKKEMTKLKKIVLREVGDEATFLNALRSEGASDDVDNEGANDETLSQRTGTSMVTGGAARPSLTQLAGATMKNGGAGTAMSNWKGRAEQIQILKGKVRSLEKQLRDSQNNGRGGDVSDGVSEGEGGGGRQSEIISLANAGSRAAKLLLNPTSPSAIAGSRPSGVRSNSSASPSFAGTRTNFDDVHEQKLKQQGALKRQEAEQTKRDLETAQALLAKEKQKSESLSLRMKHLETEQQSAKSSLQALFSKAENDDNLIASYRSQMEEVRQENKNLMKQVQKLKDQNNGGNGGNGGGAGDYYYTSSPQLAGLKKKDLLALGDPDAITNKANIARQYGHLLGGDQTSTSEGALQTVRLKLIAAEEERDNLRKQLVNVQRLYEESQMQKTGAVESKKATSASKGANKKGRRPMVGDSDDSDEDRVAQTKKKQNEYAKKSFTTSAIEDDPNNIEKISKQVARSYAWLLHSAEVNDAALNATGASPLSSASGGESPGKRGARQAIELASDLIDQQRQAILSYEKQLQQTSLVSSSSKPTGGGDNTASAEAREIQMLRQENFHLKDRIKSVTAMMNREIEMHKQTANAMLEMSAAQAKEASSNNIVSSSTASSLQYPSIPTGAAASTRPPSSATAASMSVGASKESLRVGGVSNLRTAALRSDEDIPARDDDEEDGLRSRNRVFMRSTNATNVTTPNNISNELTAGTRGGSAGSFLPAISGGNLPQAQRAATAETLPSVGANRNLTGVTKAIASNSSSTAQPSDFNASAQMRQEYNDLKKAYNTLQLQVMRQQQTSSQQSPLKTPVEHVPLSSSSQLRVPTPPAPTSSSATVGRVSVGQKKTSSSASASATAGGAQKEESASNQPKKNNTVKNGKGKVFSEDKVNVDDDTPLSNLPTPRVGGAFPRSLATLSKPFQPTSLSSPQQSKPTFRVVGEDDEEKSNKDEIVADSTKILSPKDQKKISAPKTYHHNSDSESDNTETASTITSGSRFVKPTTTSKLVPKPAVPKQSQSSKNKEAVYSGEGDYYVNNMEGGAKWAGGGPKPFSLRDEQEPEPTLRNGLGGQLPPQRRVSTQIKSNTNEIEDEDESEAETFQNPNVMLLSQTKAPQSLSVSSPTHTTDKVDDPQSASATTTTTFTFGGREPITVSSLPNNKAKTNGAASGYASRHARQSPQPRARY